MFNFILHNIVLSVPIVNSTKFIVLFLFSFESFLFKKKKRTKKDRDFQCFYQSDLKCCQSPLPGLLNQPLIFLMRCSASPTSLPCSEIFRGSLLHTAFLFLTLETLRDLNSIYFSCVWMCTFQIKLFHYSCPCSKSLSSPFLLMLFPFLAVPPSLLCFHISFKVHISCS